MSVSLKVEVAGLELRNPLVLASGILGVTPGLLKRVESAGAGAVTTKTITREPKPGNPNPVFVELEHGFLNAMGLPNPGVDEFIREFFVDEKIELAIPLIASVGGSSPEEFGEVIRKLSGYPVDAFELNLSCPHAKGYGLEVGADPSLVYEIVRTSVKNSRGKPVFVKLSANIHNIVEVAEAALKAGARGFVAINTLRALAVDIYAKKPILSNVYGGLSGPAIRPVALRVVYELYESFRNVPIIGVGGVDSWKAVVEFLLVGARAVGIGSVIAKKDLSVFREILEGLTAYLISEGYEKVSDIIGLAHELT